MIEQAKFSNSPLGGVFEKQKTIEEQGKKQIDAITDQNKRLEALTNKDNHKSICKEIFDKVGKERFDEIKELTHEIDHNLIYHFKNSAKYFLINFDDGIEFFKTIQSGEIKLEDAKELQNILKSNSNEITNGRFK